MRDLRDPQRLGAALLALKKDSRPLSRFYDLNRYSLERIPNYDSNPSCVDKYGRPDDLEPVFSEVRVK